jgi:hypothetical protein
MLFVGLLFISLLGRLLPFLAAGLLTLIGALLRLLVLGLLAALLSGRLVLIGISHGISPFNRS